MPRGPHEKKFEADIPKSLWDQYEAWAEGRGKISNRQLMAATFRLFLAAPEWLKLMALFGKGDQLEFVSSPPQAERSADARAGIEQIRRLAGEMNEETIRLLTPGEQAVLDRLRQALGPDAVAQPAGQRGKRAAGKGSR